MNYLAHACLSFGDPEILLGNMISDFVKGKKKFGYPLRVQQGITLHRAIDGFTDVHIQTRIAKSFFKDFYGLYGGAFVDIVYDHFLAIDQAQFKENELSVFSKKTYEQLSAQEHLFPAKFVQAFYYMRLHDWLYHYQFREAVYRSFKGLVNRAAFMHDASQACTIFDSHYAELQNCYVHFYPFLKIFAANQLQSLTGLS